MPSSPTDVRQVRIAVLDNNTVSVSILTADSKTVTEKIRPADLVLRLANIQTRVLESARRL